MKYHDNFNTNLISPVKKSLQKLLIKIWSQRKSSKSANFAICVKKLKWAIKELSHIWNKLLKVKREISWKSENGVRPSIVNVEIVQ